MEDSLNMILKCEAIAAILIFCACMGKYMAKD